MKDWKEKIEDQIAFELKEQIDIFESQINLKRLGNDKSFLLQFDCIFVRNDSKLLKVNF